MTQYCVEKLINLSRDAQQGKGNPDKLNDYRTQLSKEVKNLVGYAELVTEKFQK